MARRVRAVVFRGNVPEPEGERGRAAFRRAASFLCRGDAGEGPPVAWLADDAEDARWRDVPCRTELVHQGDTD